MDRKALQYLAGELSFVLNEGLISLFSMPLFFCQSCECWNMEDDERFACCVIYGSQEDDRLFYMLSCYKRILIL
ncbi:hypothetical protein SAMN04489735_100375 [Aneurinibacillus thermoaerophilus]|uniref:Uncharacterized protein n=1 Tax=Aneurinibacillus thermoaerophilus TaxID=143495 RepID=A0A1G7X952_ANETH|nr:hypothetical protein SAMN04489735_100375 [Aneurinibacillus thermoaerophilus]